MSISCKQKILLYTLLVLPEILFGRLLLEHSDTETPDKDTSLYSFEFTLSENNSRMVFDFKSELESGEVNIWLGGGGYEVIGNYTNDGAFEYSNEVFGSLNNSEPIVIRVSTKKAAGKWTIRLTEMSSRNMLVSILISGFLIIIICVVLLIGWKVNTNSSFKWPLIGAGTWFVGIVLKFGFAYFFNNPILELLKESFGQTAYLSRGSIYLGLLTGVFEIGVTLVGVVFIKGIYENAQRGIGIGLGAGTIEALLLGFSQIGAFAMVISDSPGSSDIITSLANATIHTPLFFLVAPVERIIAILCHTSSRALVVLSVVRKKQIYFWVGFLIMTAIDAIAGYAHLAGYVNTVSIWYIELALVPLAVASILMIKWYYEKWTTNSTDP